MTDKTGHDPNTITHNLNTKLTTITCNVNGLSDDKKKTRNIPNFGKQKSSNNITTRKTFQFST